MITSTNAKSDRDKYLEEGFVLGPKLLPDDLIDKVNLAMDAVIRGEYETGLKPQDWFWKEGDDPNKKLRKIDQPHLSNKTIHAAICYPQIAQWVAGITGAKKLQVFSVQLLHKPGGGNSQGSIGWHHDFQYWGSWFMPGLEAFTVWMAVRDVTESSGPMCFARGSHNWKLVNGGDFFGGSKGEVDYLKAHIPEGAKWDEVSAVMPAGAVSLHHQLTLHGSRPNVSNQPRRSLAFHLCTETNIPNPKRQADYDYVGKLDDPWECPVIYQI